MNTRQAARHLRINRIAVRKLCAAGKLGHTRASAEHPIEITEADIAAFRESRRRQAITDSAWLTVREAAARRGVSKASVYRMCASGKLVFRRLKHCRHGTILIDRKSLGPGAEALTVKQVANRLGVAPCEVYRRIAEGELTHRRVGVGRGVIRVEPAAVDQYLAEQARVRARREGLVLGRWEAKS